MYECPRCGYTTNKKSNINNHLNRKKQCKFNEEYKHNIDNIICVCNTEFSNKDDYNKHVIICRNNIGSIIKKLEEDNKELKKIYNNITVNIALTPYNNPNLNGTEKYYEEAVKKAILSIPTIIKSIHFNDKFPENHNICIKNFKNKIAKVFDGIMWKTIQEDELIDELIGKYEGELENWAEDDKDMMKYINNYKRIKQRDGQKEVHNKVKNEVKNIIYDHRFMIKNINV